jgi:hypothetical protein
MIGFVNTEKPLPADVRVINGYYVRCTQEQIDERMLAADPT